MIAPKRRWYNGGMSDEPNTPPPSALVRLQKRMTYLAIRKAMQNNLPREKAWCDQQVRDGKLSAEEAAESLAAYARVCAGSTEPTALELDMIAFVKRLNNRQGTISPNFAALYRRKAELDRNDHAPRL